MYEQEDENKKDPQKEANNEDLDKQEENDKEE